MNERERFEAGMRVRREVLGDAHVDRSLARRNAFNQAAIYCGVPVANSAFQMAEEVFAAMEKEQGPAARPITPGQ